LNNITKTSEQLRVTVNDLTPTLNRINQGTGPKLRNLVSKCSPGRAFCDISNALYSPTNLLVLQQTLDSARVTFQNAQKITSDLDELTGDPAFMKIFVN